MEVLLWLIFGLVAFFALLMYNRNIELNRRIADLYDMLRRTDNTVHHDEGEISRLKGELEALKSTRIDPSQVVPKSVHEAILGEKTHLLIAANQELVEIKSKYEQERGKAISERVRLGHVSENFAAFLDSFPYDRSKVKAMFQPIDLIYFGDDEIVFIDVKSGDSKLNDKQRNIKDLVNNGKVRFEVHQINEDGYNIK